MGRRGSIGGGGNLDDISTTSYPLQLDGPPQETEAPNPAQDAPEPEAATEPAAAPAPEPEPAPEPATTPEVPQDPEVPQEPAAAEPPPCLEGSPAENNPLPDLAEVVTAEAANEWPDDPVDLTTFTDSRDPQETATRSTARQGRRMSQVERDMDAIFTVCDGAARKGLAARRKSVDLRNEAASVVSRLDGLIALGTSTKVVIAANKFKKLTAKKFTTPAEDAGTTAGFLGKYIGVPTCFVCDTELTDAIIRNGTCELCATALNHTTIKMKKKKPAPIVGFGDIAAGSL